MKFSGFNTTEKVGIGVGTSVPEKDLTVQSATSPAIGLYSTYADTNSRNWAINTNNSAYGDFTISTSAARLGNPTTIKMSILKDGKVGIGAFPDYKFHVETGASEVGFAYSPTSQGTQTIKFNPSSTKAGGTSKIYSSYAGTGATEGKLALGTYSAQTALVIDGGSVGIGTTSPSVGLEVAKTSADASFKVNRTDQTNIQLIAAGSSYVRASAALILQSNGANNRLTLAADGSSTFAGTLTVNGTLTVGGNINKTGDLTLDVAGDIILDADSGAWRFKDNGGSIIELSVGAGSSPTFYSPVSNADILFRGNDGGSAITALTLDMSDAGTAIFNHDIKLADNGKAIFGGGNDLQIYHAGGTNGSYIDNYVGPMRFNNYGNDTDIIFQNDNGSGGIAEYFRLYGSLASASGTRYTTWPDNSRVTFGTSQDLQIYHDGSNSRITNATGSLWLQSDTGIRLTNLAVTESMAAFYHNAAVELYYDGTKKLETTSAGVTFTGTGTFSTAVAVGDAYIYTNYIRSSNLRVTDNGYLGSQSVPSVIQIQGDGDVAIGYPTTINSSLKATTILDASNSAGTNGQVLTSTGSALDWKTLSEISGVDGSGTANYIPKWTDSDTIGNSSIHEAGAGSLQIEGPSAGRFLTLNAPTTGGYITFETADTAFADIGTAKAISGNAAYSTTDLMINTRSGTKNIVFGMNGVEKVRIDNNGKVGIGTAAPSNALDVQGGTTNTAIVARSTDAKAQISLVDNSTTSVGSVVIGAEGDDLFLAAGSGGAEALRIKSDGKVGIGTATPAALLNVYSATANANGIAYIKQAVATNNPTLVVEQTVSGGNANVNQGLVVKAVGTGDGSGNTLHVYQRDNSATGLVVKGSGKVGIGNNRPIYQLHLQDDSAGGKMLLMRQDASLTGQMGEIAFGQRSYDDYVCKIRATLDSTGPGATGTGGFISFDTEESGGDLTERLRISSDGKVGIGTTAPEAKLHVKGAPGNSTYLSYLFNSATHSQAHGLNVQIASSGAAAYGLRVNTAGDTNALAVMGDGKVGMGTYTPDAKLHLYGTGIANTPTLAIENTTAGTFIHSVESFSPNMTSGQTNIIVVGRAGGYKNSGYIGYKYSSAGSDNNLLSLGHWGSNHLVNIKGDGNVGIGTTAPAHKLHIASGTTNVGLQTISTDTGAYMGFEDNSTGNTGSNSNVLIGANGNNFVVFTNATERVRIDSSGNVGIGETAPAHKLSIGDVAAIHLGYNGTSANHEVGRITSNTYNVDNSAYSLAEMDFMTSSANGYTGSIQFRTNSVNSTNTRAAVRMTILSDGKVGIGTTAPVSQLQVGDGTDSNTWVGVRGAAGYYSGIKLYRGTGTWSNNSNNNFGITVTDFGMALGKYTDPGSNATGRVDYLTVDALGKVGIGTTAPGSVQLDVRSTTVSGGSFDVQDSYTSITSGASSLWLSNSNQTAGNYIRINFADAVGGSSTALIAAKCTDHTNNYGDLQFWTRGSSGYGIRLHIDQEGSVGIGTTAPGSKLDVVGTTTVRYAAGDFSTKRLDIQAANTSNLIQSVTNPLHIYDNTAIRICMLQGGNVGIGTNAPGAKLDIVGNSNTIPALKIGANATHGFCFYERSTEGDLRISKKVSGTEVDVLNIARSDGDVGFYNNVGIGTAAPGAKLHVYGGNIRISSTDDKPQLEFFETAAARWVIGHSNSPNNYFVISEGSDIAASERLVIAPSTGSVGIGTTAPDKLLHLSSSEGTAVMRFSDTRTAMTTGDIGLIEFETFDTGSPGVGGYILGEAGGTGGQVDLAFAAGLGGSATEVMRIVSEGSVGIGTDSPTSKLQILGDASTSGLSVKAGGNGGTYPFRVTWSGGTEGDVFCIDDNLRVGIGTTAPEGRLHIYNGSSGGTTVNVAHDDLIIENSDNVGIQLFSPADKYQYLAFGDPGGANRGYVRYYHTDDRMVLRAGGSDTLYITGGKVGIGTASPDQKLSVSGNIQARSGGWFIARSADNAGYSYLKNPSTSGSEIAFHTSGEKMRILSNGKVGIGTNAPWTRFTVSGGTTAEADDFIPMSVSPSVSGGNSAGVLFGVYPAAGYAKQGIFWERYASTAGYGGRGKLHFVNRDATDTSVPTIADAKMTILEDGKVGIGTDAPGQALTVRCANTVSPFSLLNSSNSNNRFLIVTSTANNARLSLYDSSAVKMFLNTAGDTYFTGGDVGIGTTNPAVPLHIYSTANDVLKIQGADHARVLIDGTAGSEKTLNFSDAGTLKWKIGMDNVAPVANFVIKNNDDGAPQFVIDNGGNAKITSSSNVYLSLDTTQTNGDEWHIFNAVSGTKSGLQFKDIDTSKLVMLLQEDGNVGIGNAAPSAKLEIKGTGATTGLTFKTTDSVGNASFWIKDGGRVGVHYFPFVVNQDSTDTACPASTLMYIHSASPFTIKTDGKVGIGTTAPATKLTIESSATGESISDGLRLQNSHGANNDISPIYFGVHGGTRRAKCGIGWKRTGSYGIGKLLFALDNNGDDADVSFANDTKITFQGDGNVGIGTTAPAYKLQIHESTSGTNYIQLTNSTTGSGSGDGLLVGVNAAEDAIFWNLENTAIRFATNGADRLTISSSGTVFMPNGSAFAFANSSGVIQSVLSLNSSNVMILGGTGMATNAYPIRNIAKYMTFEPAGGLGLGVETMRITNASFAGVGSVGIGTNAPTAPLEVRGADSGITISSASASRPHLRLVNGTTNMLQLSANGAYAAIGDGTDANRYMSFKGGSVGIGTTAPAALLHAYGGNLPFLSTSTTGSDMGQFTSNLTTYARLRIDCAASGDAQVSFMSAQVTKWSIGNDAGDSHKFKIATGFGAFSGAENLMIQQDGNIGIGTNSAGYKFHVQGDILASGSIMGNSKSFVIDHPTKPNSKLQYGALEGPEFGVYYRGRAQSNTITLPDYWTALVREETITVQLTPKGSFQHLYVVSQSLTEIVIGAADGETIDCFYTIYGERADIDRLEVEK